MEKKYSSFDEIKEIVSEVLKKAEIKKLACVACGGSLACLQGLEYFIKTKSQRISVNSFTASEFAYAPPEYLDENTVVIVMSASGNTSETVNAAKKAKEKKAIVVSFSGKAESSLSSLGDFTVLYSSSFEKVFANDSFGLPLLFGMELVNQTEGYAEYDKAIEAFNMMQEIGENSFEISKDFADAFTSAHKYGPVIYSVSSGATSGVAYSESICTFMEMGWMNSAFIHSGELFHGPFEVTDEKAVFLVFLNDGRTRELDERAIRFLNQYAGSVTIIDAREYGSLKLHESVREYFSPMILNAVGTRITTSLAEAQGHSLERRRYMFQVKY